MSVFCNTTTTTMVDDVECTQCAHCNMFGHVVGDCAMLTGEYASENRSSQNVCSPHIFRSNANNLADDDDDYDEDYVDYYVKYDHYLGAYDNEPGVSLCDPMEHEGEEWGPEDGGEGNTLTEEEYAQWMREAEEEDEYADYTDDHSPEADVRWVKQSSMAAFSHFQETGAKLKNSEFVGKKAGAPLRSENEGR